jgi:hypothetical protein
LVGLTYNGNALDTESKAFIDAAVPAITTNWSEQQLIDRALPELLQTTQSNDLHVLFHSLSRLGTLTEYNSSMGEALMSYVVGNGQTVQADYLAKAKYRNGEARFRIRIVKKNGAWLILGFHVDPVLSQRAEQRI